MKFSSKKSITVFLLITMVLMVFSLVPSSVNGTTDDGFAAYYKFDGNLTDSSSNGNNGTAVGDITFVKGINGNAALFNGESYIEVPSSTSLNLGKNMSVSVWLYKNFDTSQNTSPIVTKSKDTVVHQSPYTLYDRLLKPVFELGIPTGSTIMNTKTIVDMHKWEFVTFTYDGQEMKFYVDGKLTDIKAYSKELIVSTGKLYIGMMFASNKNWFYNGYMDELRIYGKTLSYDDVKSMYKEVINGTGKNIVIKPPQQMAYYKFNGNVNDSSGFKNNATVIGNEEYKFAAQGKGFVFDGETYLEVQDSDSLEADTGLTLSTWMKVDTLNIKGNEWPLIDRPQASIQPRQSAFKYHARVFGDGNSGQLCSYLINDGNTSPVGHMSKNIDASIGKWCMLTVTFDDATKTMTYYINGKQIDIFTNKFFSLRHSGGKLIIGMMENSKFFKGIMDEMRIYNYTMTNADVMKLYNYKDTLKVSNTQAQLSSIKVKGKLQLKILAISPELKELPVDIKNGVKYTSSNTTVATVSATGVITGVKKGKAKITVTNDVNTATANVVVK